LNGKVKRRLHQLKIKPLAGAAVSAMLVSSLDAQKGEWAREEGMRRASARDVLSGKIFFGAGVKMGFLC
jgi:hypothetical protein